MFRHSLPLILRGALIAVLIVLLGQLLRPGVDYGGFGQELMRNAAAVSAMSTSVPRNEVNMLAAEIDHERSALDARESELALREAMLGERLVEEVRKENRKTLLAILVTALLLLALVLLNFYFDLHRSPGNTIRGNEDEGGASSPDAHDHSHELVTKL